MKTEKNKTTIKKWFKKTIIIFIVIFFVSGLTLIIQTININNINNKVLYKAIINNNLTYKVKLKNNDLFDNDVISQGEIYPSLFVSEIEGNFNYNLISDDHAPMQYEYYLDATLIGEYKLNDEDTKYKIWSKNSKLITNQRKESTATNNIEINETFKINYEDYNLQASEFKKTLKIPATTILKVTMTVNSKIYKEGNLKKDTQKISFQFPLTTEAFKIEENYNKTKVLTISNYNKEPVIKNKKIFLLGVTFNAFGTSLLVLFFNSLFQIKKQSIYQKRIKKILKKYNEIIVEVHNDVDDSNLNVVEVMSFEEMINLEEELRVPIIYYEKEKNLLSEFSLVHGNILYKYIYKKIK